MNQINQKGKILARVKIDLAEWNSSNSQAQQTKVSLFINI